MALKEKLAALVDLVTIGVKTASKKTAEGMSDLDQQMENQGEIVELERKPDGFDDKRDKYKDTIKKDLHDVIEKNKKNVESTWKVASSDEVPDGVLNVAIQAFDGHEERFTIKENRLDDILMRSTINGWVVKEVKANHEAPEWFKIAEDVATQSEGTGGGAFDYLVSMMSQDTGMTIDKAIDETKNVFYKPDGAPSEVATEMSKMESDMSNLELREKIGEMENGGAKFTPGPTTYINRLYSLYQNGVHDMSGIQVQASDFENVGLRTEE